MKIKFKWKLFSELTTDELYAIIHLRQKVFIVEQDCPYIDADYTCLLYTSPSPRDVEEWGVGGGGW